jgi:hypothetical protein
METNEMLSVTLREEIGGTGGDRKAKEGGGGARDTGNFTKGVSHMAVFRNARTPRVIQ